MNSLTHAETGGRPLTFFKKNSEADPKKIGRHHKDKIAASNFLLRLVRKTNPRIKELTQSPEMAGWDLRCACGKVFFLSAWSVTPVPGAIEVFKHKGCTDSANSDG